MEIKEMSVEELETRKVEIAGEIDGLENIEDVNARSEEITAINAELESRAAVEEAKAEVRAAVAAGTDGTEIKKFEEEKEERKMFERNSIEYRNAWLKNLKGEELSVEERAGFTQEGTYATNAIPTIVADKFFEKMKKVAPMLSEITLMNVAGNLTFVAEGTRNAAAKHTENSAVSAAEDTTVKVTLGAIEFMKVLGISKSAKMMSVDNFETWLVDMLAGDIARAIDDYIINDSTNGIAAGIFTTNTNQIVNGATTGYTYKNVVDLIALLPAAYDAEAKFLVNKKTLYGQIAGILDSTNRPIFVESPEAGLTGRIMGYPVVVDDYVATANNGLYLGRWADVVGNLSEGPDVETSAEAGFLSGSIMYRGYASFDSKVAKNDAIVRLVSTTA